MVLTSTHNLYFEPKRGKYKNKFSENFPFLVVNFLICLNRRVFVNEYRTKTVLMYMQTTCLLPRFEQSQLLFYVNLHRAVIGPSATLTGRWRPDIDLRRMRTNFLKIFLLHLHRAVIGPSATLTGRWRPDIDLRRMLTGNYRIVDI